MSTCMMCLLQLLVEVKATLRHQVTVEYNATATYTTRTRSRTHRLTVAWDSLQTRVMMTRLLAGQIGQSSASDAVLFGVDTLIT